MLILGTNGRRDGEAAVRDLAGRVDGLAVLGRTVGDEVIADLAATGLPVVLLARDPVAGVDTIRTRNAPTARVLAEHLIAHGHRRIAFLGDPAGAPDVAGRYAGIREGIEGAGIAGAGVGGADAHLVPLPGFDLEAGEAAARDLLRRRERPQAVVCANDEVALGVLLAAGAATTLPRSPPRSSTASATQARRGHPRRPAESGDRPARPAA